MFNLMNMTVDFSAIGRAIRKSIVTLLLIVVIVSCMAYVLWDTMAPQKYECSVDIGVIVTNNSPSSYNALRMRQTVSQYANIINNDAIKGRVLEKMGVGTLPGSYTATGSATSNIVTLTCTADNPTDALRIAKTVCMVYADVLTMQKSIFALNPLGSIKAENVRDISMSPEMIAGMAGLVVLAIGIFLVAAGKIFDGTVQNVKRAGDLIDAAYVGSIGHQTKNDHPGKKVTLLISQLNVSFGFVEQVRKAAMNIAHSMDHHQEKILLVTGVAENEGKSTVAANIALALAEKGKKVILIDADLRKPAMHLIFEQKVQRGLGDYLQNGKSPKKLFSSDPNLSIKFCFTNPVKENVGGLLESEAMDELLNAAREEADYIVIDTPPCGVARDAMILAEKADAVLMVIREEWSKVDAINEKFRELGDCHARLCGYVLNDEYELSDGGTGNYGRHSGYGQYGSYGRYGRYGRYESKTKE